MNRFESKYFNTAIRMDEALLELLETKSLEYITIKEICDKAQVNRSTFYLHYDSVIDLFNESVKFVNNQFESYFCKEHKIDIENINKVELSQLCLVTPKYLRPYLQYIKDHKRLFETIISKSNLFGSKEHFNTLFNDIFSPIMSRYHIEEDKKRFYASYIINGIIGIIKLWLKNDCKESIEFILNTILECINSTMETNIERSLEECQN